MTKEITVTLWFDEKGFYAALSKRLALRSATDFEQVVEEMFREFIHIGEPKEWPDILI